MSESSPDNKSEDPESTTPAVRKLSRRQMLGVLGLGINAIAGAMIAAADHRLYPRAREPPAHRQGTPVGLVRRTDEVSRGPNAVRDVSQSHLGAVGRRHRRRGLLGAADRARTSGRCSRSTARILAARCDGFRNRASSCVRVTAAFTTPTARAPRARRRADSYTYDYKMEGGQLWIKAGQMPTLSDMPSVATVGKDQRRHMRLIERLKKVGAWFDARLQLGKPVREAATHRVPRRSASWFYVFGSASLTLFILQVVTGICLALVYVPSADGAWGSLEHLNQCRPSAGSSARCTAGAQTSWSRWSSSTCARCLCLARSNIRVS